MPNNPFMPNNNGSMPRPAANPAPMPGKTSAGPDTFEVDLTNAGNVGTIPPGPYRVRCTDIEQTVSKSGNPMFAWTFEIIAGNYSADYVGKELKVFTAITPAAMWKVAETVQALGVGQSGSVVRFKRSDVLNKECGAMIDDSEYNGQTRSQIQRVISTAEYMELINGAN